MKPLLSELFLPCSGMHSPIRANRYPLATITGAQRASGQTHSRARSHQDDADLRADRSTAYLVSCIRVRSAHGNSFVESGTRSLGQCPTTAGTRRHDGRSVRASAVKPRACGAPQKRRWGLTAWRGRAIPVTVPPMPHHDAPVNHRTGCRTMSDRSSAGFLNS